MTRTDRGQPSPSATMGLLAAFGAALRRNGTAAPRLTPRAGLPLAFLLAVLAVLYISVAPALAATPETPEATEVKEITPTTATLNGVLNPHALGAPGSFQFSYAPSETLECANGSLAPVPPSLAVGGAEKEAVSTPVTELQPNRKYAVCLTAFSFFCGTVCPEPGGRVQNRTGEAER